MNRTAAGSSVTVFRKEGICLAQNGSAERYLHAVQMLSEKYCCVRSVDVAHYLRCSKASVSVTVRQLTEKGLLAVEPDGHLVLTPAGLAYMRDHSERASFFRSLLTDAGVDPSQAEGEAFTLARAVSRETFEKLRAHLRG